MISSMTMRNLSVSCCMAAMLATCSRTAETQMSKIDFTRQLSSYDVVWNEPGTGSADSMPLGNGDIGLNVWTEPNGDLLFYIGKTDAWSEHPRAETGLMKVGLVRVSLSPNPYVVGKPLIQTLKLHEAEIEVQEAKTSLRIWVDANRPVIHIEMNSDQPLKMKAELTPWYTEADKIGLPTVLQGQKDQVAWFHHNGRGSDPEVLNWTVGGIMKGDGLVNANAMTLESAQAAPTQVLSIYPFSASEHANTAPSAAPELEQPPAEPGLPPTRSNPAPATNRNTRANS